MLEKTKVCKVSPRESECDFCEAFNGQNVDCENCAYNKRTYELLCICCGKNGFYAFLEDCGKILTVEVDRIYDLKEVKRDD